MGGFGGVIKNQSIGVASAAGKAYIHSAGKTRDVSSVWNNLASQDDFLESMAASAPGGGGLLRGQNFVHQCDE